MTGFGAVWMNQLLTGPSNTLQVSSFSSVWTYSTERRPLLIASNMLSRPTGSDETAILLFLHLSSLPGSIFGFSPLKFWKIAFSAHSSPSSSCVMNRFSVLICGFLCLRHYSNRDVTSVPHTELLAFIRQAWERALTFIMDLKPAHYGLYAWTVWEIFAMSFFFSSSFFFGKDED